MKLGAIHKPNNKYKMSKVTVQSPTYKNRQTRIGEAGHVLVTDENGVAKVSQELAELLLSEKYAFMGFQNVNGDDIKKVEEDDLSKTEQGEDIKQPETEEKTPAEIIEEETQDSVDSPSQNDQSQDSGEDEDSNDDIRAIIKASDDLGELREIATTLEFSSSEWEGYKRKDYFKRYLLEKIA